LGFEKLVFPGMWQWMRWLSFGLLWLMTSIHDVIPDWGVVILLLAVMVRLAMYPIAQKAWQVKKHLSGFKSRYNLNFKSSRKIIEAKSKVSEF
jgi:hypothetical protein